MILIAAVVAVVAVIGVVVALVVGGGDDSDDATATVPMSGLLAACSDDTASPTGGPSAPTGTIELAPFPDDDIYKPVAVEGEALPPFSPEVRSGEQPDTAWCRGAPIVAGYDYAGNRVTIDPATDGPTMVVLLAHWCPHCNAEIPVLNEWRDSGGVPEGLNIVGVSTGVSPDAPNYPPDEWLTSNGLAVAGARRRRGPRRRVAPAGDGGLRRDVVPHVGVHRRRRPRSPAPVG